MPSKLPTISVRLKPHVFEVFSRLAELQGRSRGSVVAELLETVHPPLMRTVALLEAARDAPAQVQSGLLRTLEDMEMDLVQVSGGSLAQMDMLIERARQPARVQAERSAAAAPAAAFAQKSGKKGGSTPVLVTRGSGRGTGSRSRTRKPRSGGV